jgi:hypothetical protein
MKPSMLLAAAAVLALSACGQPAATDTATTAASTAPADMKTQIEHMDVSMQPVFAWQQLMAYQAAHPEATPPCPKVRRAESEGVIPANVAPNTIYTPFAGQLVFSVQCGQQLTTVHNDPHQHWLVSFAPGAASANVVNCADAHGNDQCVRPIPMAGAATP